MSAVPVELTEVELAELIKTNERAKIVYDWMKIRKFFVKAIKPDEGSFQFEGISGSKVGFIVVQPNDTPRSVIVVSNLKILPIHEEAMSKLPPQERDSFFWNLKRELIFAPATFFMHPNGSNTNMIQFAKEISFDELTEGRLFEAMDAICRSTVWTIWSLIRKFGPEDKQ